MATAANSPPDARNLGVFRKLLSEGLGRFFVTVCAGIIILITLLMIFFVAYKGIAAFRGPEALSVSEVLFNATWAPWPTGMDGQPSFGILIFLVGSLLVSGLAVLFAAPLAVAAAIFTTEIAPHLGERYLRPALEMFTGVPSVVYGWVGLTVLVPFIRNYVGGLGFSLLAGSIVVAVMILPSIATLTIDALKALPNSFKEGSLALGATRWQTIRHVLVPAAGLRIGTAITLGLARALGEALAVQMVIGNSIQFPRSLLHGTSTLTSIMTMDMSNTLFGSLWNNVLWTMAFLLLCLTLLLVVLIRRMGGTQKRGVR
ncbi:MAG TPA: phosphate ABC transporter permease subunit PstC [Firmicutes bacterium]|jgi:phosphate transport system permease protein|nr:phosphate ABC transporter permease subunit PstC [Bacillota bacterium]